MKKEGEFNVRGVAEGLDGPGIRESEKKLLHAELSPEQRDYFIGEVRRFDPAMAEFFEGTIHHERFKVLCGGFNFFLKESFPEVPYHMLTKEQSQEAFNSYPRKDELQKEFVATAEYYKQARKHEGSSFQGGDLSVVDLAMAESDLWYQREIFTTEGEQRSSMLEASERELHGKLTTWFEQDGKRAEYQLLLIVRHLLRNEGLDHLMQITHALPREDRKTGIDFRITAGDTFFDFDLKTEVSDSRFGAESVDMKRYRASKSALAHRKNADVLTVNIDDIKDAYKAVMEEDTRSSREILDKGHSRKLIQVLMNQLPEESDASLVLSRLIKREKVEWSEKDRAKVEERMQSIVNALVIRMFEELLKNIDEEKYLAAMSAEPHAYGEIKSWLVEAMTNVVLDKRMKTLPLTPATLMDKLNPEGSFYEDVRTALDDLFFPAASGDRVGKEK